MSVDNNYPAKGSYISAFKEGLWKLPYISEISMAQNSISKLSLVAREQRNVVFRSESHVHS